MKIDFEKFKGALPYASELYGVYQPLLGWRSGLLTRRIDAGLRDARNGVFAKLLPRFRPQVELRGQPEDPRELNFRIGLAAEKARLASPIDASGSLIAKRVLASVQRDGIDNPSAWHHVTHEAALTVMLDDLTEQLRSEYDDRLQVLHRRPSVTSEDRRQLLTAILNRESIVAGALHFLHRQGDFEGLMALASPLATSAGVGELFEMYRDISLMIDPRRSDLARAVISPIGVAHIFRQFFFEFDTFLGPSVEHLWLSPGGTVELVEVSTRRQLVERVTEIGVEAALHTETSLTQQDELSDAVRQENASNTKFGVSLNTNNAFSLGSVFTTAIGTGTSFELDDSEKTSRENLHKSLRQQTEKVSTDLKRSFKSVFRTVTETTDTKSRRHVIQNTTDNLVNYELRRKMRQVGVQVQDLGTYLCWQTYVDLPGEQLGLANMVHIAAPGDMEPKQQPDLPPPVDPYKGDVLKHSFTWPFDDDEDNPDIQKEFHVRRFTVVPKPGYKLERAEIVVTSEPKWGFQWRGLTPQPVAPNIAETTNTEVEIFHPVLQAENRQPLTDEHPKFDLEITTFFTPSAYLQEKIRAEREQALKEAKEEKEREYKEKLFKAVEERVKLASEIVPRKFEDLREEERIVVYRKLIAQLLADTGLQEGAIDEGNARLRHVFAELIQSMFDVEKMLYFVAPEWWTPHTRRANQQHVFVPVTVDGQTVTRQEEFLESATVSWGGARGERPDNYLITKDSARAPLGSSLGWVIQLDGDNLRNAFLNAPWVKAVIPIREGREQQAFTWLSASNVEGADGLEGAYQPTNAAELPTIRATLGLPANHQVTLRDALTYLIQRVQEKQTKARTKPVDAQGAELDYLPTEQVYEHGFYPLQGGFKAAAKDFEVFDQWVEIVPTDQIVPVPVEYDAKTGLLK